MICMAVVASTPARSELVDTQDRPPVLDDDTIEVPQNTHLERVRLSGIDCPENGDAYGMRSKEVTQPGYCAL